MDDSVEAYESAHGGGGGNPTAAGVSSISVDPNQAACVTVGAYISDCESLTPAFTNLPYSQQITCLCYSSGNFDPGPFDNAAASCYNYLRTVDPGDAAAFSSAIVGFCSTSVAASTTATATTTAAAASTTTHSTTASATSAAQSTSSTPTTTAPTTATTAPTTVTTAPTTTVKASTGAVSTTGFVSDAGPRIAPFISLETVCIETTLCYPVTRTNCIDVRFVR